MSSLAQKVLASSAIMLLIRFIQRGIGVISTIILARLLVPADFGIVALCAVTVYLFDMLSTAGSAQYIIQKQDLNVDDLNTAWSIDIIMKSSLWAVLMLSAPWISTFLEEDQLTEPLRVISFVLIINAMLNPGLTLLRKELDYRKILRVSIIQKLLSFAAVISVALITRSYWAQIIGDLVSAAAYVVGSYLIHPFRPRFSLKKVKEQFKFSQWLLLKGLFGYMRSHIDTFLIKKMFNLDDLGKFHLSKYLTTMPATDIISPAIEPLLSAFSKAKEDPDDLAYKVRFCLCVIIVLVLPICTYIAIFSAPIIDTFFGSKWSGAYGILSALSLSLFTISLSHVFENCFIALAKVKQLFVYDVMSFLVVVGSLLMVWGQSIELFAWVRSGVGIALSLCLLIYTSLLVNFSVSRVLFLCWPPAISSVCASLVSLQLNHFELHFFVKLCVSSGAFFSVYLVGLILSYQIAMYRCKEYQHAKDILFTIVLSRIPLVKRWLKPVT